MEEHNMLNPRFSGTYMRVLDLAMSFAAGAEDKVMRLKHVLSALQAVDPSAMETVLSKKGLALPPLGECKPAEVTPSVRISSQTNRFLSLNGGRLEDIVRPFGPDIEVGTVHLAAALAIRPRGPVLEMLELNGISPKENGYADDIRNRVREYTAGEQHKSLDRARPERLRQLRAIRSQLHTVCFGQDAALDAIVSRIASAWNLPPAERGAQPLSFAFVGGPGTGKSLCADALCNALIRECGFASAVIDMSRYACNNLAVDLVGRDSAWRDNGRTGVLTDPVARNPRTVLVLDNFDRAHAEALAYVGKLISDGVVEDGFTRESVSFAQCIVILTSNRGTEKLESGKFAKLCKSNGGTVPREKLVEGLVAGLECADREKSGAVGEILSKCSCPVLFHAHTVESLSRIVARAVDDVVAHIAAVYRAEIDCDHNALVGFFLDTLQKTDSAHGITQVVESVLMTNLDRHAMDSEEFADAHCPKIHICVDPLPEIALNVPEGLTLPETLAFRTAARLKQAKRLEYDVTVESQADRATVRLTHFHHVVMPAIEDAGWFCVRPPDTDFSDLVGLDLAWQKAMRALDEAGNAGKPDHILLYGPPGTGKTAFAKALAKKLERSFISVNGADFTTSSNDTRAVARIGKLFATAERYGAVLFIDEIDAIGSRDNVIPTQAAVVNALLTELDGFEDRRILVIAATNRKDMLDPALLRAGRLHTCIDVGVLKNREDRLRLVDLFCTKSKFSIPTMLREFIVETTDGWAPANILSVLRETRYRANGNTPQKKDYLAARLAEFAGEETQRPPLTEDEKRHIAAHEAGHALAACLYGHAFVQASIVGFADNLGFVENLQNGHIGRSAERLCEYIDVALAGRAAETLLGTPAEGCESDFAKATGLARTLFRSGLVDTDELAVAPGKAEADADWKRLRPRINTLLRERLTRVTQLLSRNMEALRAVAEELVRNGTVFAEDMARLRANADGKKKGTAR